jgi:ATP-dependent protease HslVU (ClpYQ) peptidase subunit
MTVVAALHKDGQTWVVGDRLTSWHDFQRIDQVNNTKIIKFKNALIGFCGRTLFGNVLQYWVDNRNKAAYRKLYNHSFKTEADVHDFFNEYYEHLKKWYGLGGAGQDDVAKIQYATFLVVTPQRIYEVSACRDVNAFANYTAIGSGKDIIASAIDALVPVVKKPEEILQRAYGTCIKLTSGCGGDMELINVNRYLLSAPATLKTKTKTLSQSAKKPITKKKLAKTKAKSKK